MIYGYARVSTDGRRVDAQVKQLRAAGAVEIFKETASGAKTDRARLRRALAQLDAGDVLTVTRLDRLARSTRDLLNTLAQIGVSSLKIKAQTGHSSDAMLQRYVRDGEIFVGNAAGALL
jgi:DNA invertase Pin-like site-specific DNA recombinase